MVKSSVTVVWPCAHFSGNVLDFFWTGSVPKKTENDFQEVKFCTHFYITRNFESFSFMGTGSNPELYYKT